MGQVLDLWRDETTLWASDREIREAESDVLYRIATGWHETLGYDDVVSAIEDAADYWEGEVSRARGDLSQLIRIGGQSVDHFRGMYRYAVREWRRFAIMEARAADMLAMIREEVMRGER